jgi:hypothetical protein
MMSQLLACPAAHAASSALAMPLNRPFDAARQTNDSGGWNWVQVTHCTTALVPVLTRILVQIMLWRLNGTWRRHAQGLLIAC